jgi:hypothetical protein
MPALESAPVTLEQLRPHEHVAPPLLSRKKRFNGGRGHHPIALCEVRQATDRHSAQPTKKRRTSIRTGSPSQSLTQRS